MTPLRDHLLDAYGGFADQRCKDPNLDRPIKVDDRDTTDVSPYFCAIFVSIPDRNGETLKLTLQHCPTSPEVFELVEKFGGSVHPGDLRPTIVLSLKASQGPVIKRLARAIKAIVGRGRTYDDPNLRWICPRTATSLLELAEHLALYQDDRWPEDSRTPDMILARRRQWLDASHSRPRSGNGSPGGLPGRGE